MSAPPARSNLVVFCGAGFSAGASLPTMASFGRALRTSPLLTDLQRNDFQRIQIACNAILAQTGATATNLEDLASLLATLQLSRPDIRFSECEQFQTLSDARHLLEECIRTVYSPESHNYRFNSMPLFNQTLHHANLTLITTNYDLNIELGAASSGLPLRPSPSVQRACLSLKADADPDRISLYDNSLLKDTEWRSREAHLYKLHGSVNWYTTPSGLVVNDLLRVTERHENGTPRTYRLDPDVSVDLAPENRRLVAPSVVKGDGLAALAQEWTHASEAISSADNLWFIGYSFPESDAFMRYFLAGALQRNVSLKQILLVDPNAPELVHRTARLFGPPAFGGTVELLPLDWSRAAHFFGAILVGTWQPTTADTTIQQLRRELEGRAVLRGDIGALDDDHQQRTVSRLNRLGRLGRLGR